METLSKDLIKVPALWRLALEIGETDVEVVINTSVEDNSLIYCKLPLNKAMAQLPALEDLIYENPLLLADFSKVDILLDTQRFTIVPSTVTSDDERAEIMSAIWPDEDYEIVANELADCDATLLMAVDTQMLAFLRRTFLDVEVRHPLAVLASYFAPRSRQGNCGKIYANLRPKAVEVVAFSSHTPWSIPAERNAIPMRRTFLRIANTFRIDNPADASYYVLASAQTAGFSLKSDEIVLCGPKDLRQQVLPTLREFASVVMPVLSPSEMLRSGQQAFDAPLELVILPLI